MISQRGTSPVPKTEVPLDRALDSTETASTERPAVVSNSRLLSRSRTGLGRLLRGTAQATLIAFWIGLAQAERAVERGQRADDDADGRSPAGPRARPSWSPMIGNWLSAELSTSCCSSGVALQHEAEDRGGQQQQREDRDERVVGDDRGQVVALVVEELVDHRERDPATGWRRWKRSSTVDHSPHATTLPVHPAGTAAASRTSAGPASASPRS